MGGDFGPLTFTHASLIALKRYSELSLHLFGDQSVLETYFKNQPQDIKQRLTLVHTTETVSLDEKPSQVLRSKSHSSMHEALEALNTGQVDACVSAGNTGALMGLACSIIKLIPGIHRPAIVVKIPTKLGEAYMLDLGANVNPSSDDLHQFAIMGSIMSAHVDKIETPKVGLLNIGVEENKGNDLVKQTDQLFKDDDFICYSGFVEANQIFSGDYQVIVTDGFTGNNVLKAIEGTVNFMALQYNNVCQSNWRYRLLKWIASPVMSSFKKSVNPEEYNGASFLGLNKTVVKSHGGASVKATVKAIEKAMGEVSAQIPQRIQKHLQPITEGKTFYV